MSQSECPFLLLCDRNLHGPDLSQEEQAGFEGHLSEGCPVCEARIEDRLSGRVQEEESSPSVAELNAALGQAVHYAEERMESRRVLVLARIRQSIGEDDGSRGRARRRLQRVIFYVTWVAALFLITVAYVGTSVLHRYQRRGAQALATNLELAAMTRALARYVQDGNEVPKGMGALVRGLSGQRAGQKSPYYRFSAKRFRGEEYLDEFGSPFLYITQSGGGVLLYSAGANGVDEEGKGDDLSLSLRFAR